MKKILPFLILLALFAFAFLIFRPVVRFSAEEPNNFSPQSIFDEATETIPLGQ